MSREKQIDEMAKDVASTPIGTVKPDLTLTEMGEVYKGEFILRIAKHLYTEGYRKIPDDHSKQVACYTLGCQEGDKIARQVAAEIFAEIETSLVIGGFVNGEKYIAIREDDYNHYKKKYTGEGK